jgi:hypothetical protein
MFVYSSAVKQEALALIAAGENDCEVARRLAVPRTTVRDWRRRPAPTRCPRCWERARGISFNAADYAELLGLYLGDGHITSLARTHRLRISLDARHSMIVDESEALLRRCLSSNRVGRLAADGGATIVLWVYGRHLPCLFPQHGPGKKHERRITLEPWQQQLVESAPWAFLRGCIRSDGCVFVNRTGRYEYVSYDFTNRSADIRSLFIDACGLVGVACRTAGYRVRIYRRESVALMLEHVGLKR